MSYTLPNLRAAVPITKRFRRRLLGVGVAAAAACGIVAGLTSCQLATAFAGEGFDRRRGVTLPGVGDTVIVAVTHAVLDGSKRARFDEHTRRVVASLPEYDGYVGHSVRSRVLGHEVWTMTVWRDEAAVREFLGAPAHREAIREGLSGVKTAQFLRMEWPRERVPPRWSEMLKRLKMVEVIDYSGGERSAY